jgi:hypothetical protein
MDNGYAALHGPIVSAEHDNRAKFEGIVKRQHREH